jgi:hypothetical protein
MPSPTRQPQGLPELSRAKGVILADLLGVGEAPNVVAGAGICAPRSTTEAIGYGEAQATP